MTDSSNGMVTRVLELASKRQIADALMMVDEMMASGKTIDEIESLRLLLSGANAVNNGNHERGIQNVLPALKQLEKNDYKHLLDWAYSTVGFTMGVLGNPQGGLDWVGRAIAGAERSGDKSQIQRSLWDEARLFAMLGDDERSILSFERAAGLNALTSSTKEHMEFLNDFAHANLKYARSANQDDEKRNDLAQKALTHASTAMDLMKETENDDLKARTLENMGSALSILGKFTEAEEAFKDALSLLENDDSGLVETLTSYASLLGQTNRYVEADMMLNRAYNKALQENLDASLDRILETRIHLELFAGKYMEALLWSERRFHALEEQYKKKIASAVEGIRFVAELEYESRSHSDDLTALPDNFQQSRFWRDETLKDPLTNCFNRRGLTVLSGPFFASQNKTALALVDLDQFKNVNDSFGQETGDKVIQAIAEIIKKCFRDTDLVTRYGGEEFLVLLKGIEPNVAWGVCERLRLAIEHFGWGKIADGLHVTASIGLSVRTNDDYLDALTEKADVSLHRAKDEGRNKVVLLQ